MKVLDAGDPDAVGEAAKVVAAGGVIGVPTDTVYGLAADPFDRPAVDRLFAVKDRPSEVALPVLVTGWDQVADVAGTLETAARRLAERYWPGPLTLVVPRSAAFRVDLGGTAAARWTVGVRWPDHPTMQALCSATGPLAVTSANLHGQQPATTALSLARAFEEAGHGDGVSLVLDGGRCDGVPSTVVECRGPASKCLRDGAIPWHDLAGDTAG